MVFAKSYAWKIPAKHAWNCGKDATDVTGNGASKTRHIKEEKEGRNNDGSRSAGNC